VWIVGRGRRDEFPECWYEARVLGLFLVREDLLYHHFRLKQLKINTMNGILKDVASQTAFVSQ
jgi:hypothetical protein